MRFTVGDSTDHDFCVALEHEAIYQVEVVDEFCRQTASVLTIRPKTCESSRRTSVVRLHIWRRSFVAVAVNDNLGL